MARLKINGYGQVELNNVAFRRDGRIEAQCKAVESMKVVENGMLLAIDSVKKVVAPATNGDLPIGLVYSAEHIYDGKTDLKNFYLKADSEDFLPRLGYLAKGDKFHTNCIDFTGNEDALIQALEKITETPLYGGACENGAIRISTEKPTFGPVLEVVKKSTMPNGELGVQFRVLAE